MNWLDALRLQVEDDQECALEEFMLPLDLAVKAGICKIHAREVAQAEPFFEVLMEQNPAAEEFGSLFIDVAQVSGFGVNAGQTNCLTERCLPISAGILAGANEQGCNQSSGTSCGKQCGRNFPKDSLASDRRGLERQWKHSHGTGGDIAHSKCGATRL
jgi:hypothetical protein